MANPLHEDIMFGILSRLPVKSLARFRCVCKSWLKYINDPYLHTIHVKEEPTPILFEISPRGIPVNTKISFLHGTTSLRKKPVLELCFKGHSLGYMLLGSCNGLILVCSYLYNSGVYQFALINPLKKERCDLPPIPTKTIEVVDSYHSYHWASGIGFDDSTNTLKTVFFANLDPKAYAPCAMVHSSGSSSWREAAQKPAYPIKGEGVFAHGRLHWLADPFNTFSVSVTVTDRRRILLVWFDVKTEEFGLTDPPKPEEGDCRFDYNKLVDLNGQLGFSYYTPTGIKIWILKQHEEWVLHCCFDTRPILPPQYNSSAVELLGCWNNEGDILLRSYDSRDRLLVYTLNTGDLREVDREDDACGGLIQMYQSSSLLLLPTSYPSAPPPPQPQPGQRWLTWIVELSLACCCVLEECFG